MFDTSSVDSGDMGDSHHTSVSGHVTHGSNAHGTETVCGTGEITTHPFPNTVPGFALNGQISGCVTDGGGGIHFTGPGGFSTPSTGINASFEW